MKRLIPSMFHRRLVLIGAGMALGVVAVGAQLGRLTLVRGAELRDRAESRLRYAEWLPTTRGRILDRKGRVLAQDRASYRVAVAYPAIDGSWAREQAEAYARRQNRSRWRKLSAVEREALIGACLPAFQRHLDAAWATLSERTGVAAEDLGQDRDEVIATVEAMAEHLHGVWDEQFLAEHAATGRAMEPDDVARRERLRRQRIAEQEAAHVVVRSVSDEVAFELLRVRDEVVDLDPSGSGAASDVVRVPLIPGLEVEDGTTREYPFESVVVDVDQRTLPLPLRADGYRSVAAGGVLSDLLGWMGTPNVDVINARERRLAEDDELAGRTMGEGLGGRVDLGQYRPGDQAGTRGVEASMESTLRGLRGQRIVRRDTGEVEETPAARGRDVFLTIDAMLQARVQAAMSPDLGLARVQGWHGNHAVATGTPLDGAAVVIDVDTGDILALVSTPGVTQVERRRAEGRALAAAARERARREAWEVQERAARERDPSREAGRYVAGYDPRVDPDALMRYNRAIGVAYAPGSIAKVVVLLEAIRQGCYTLAERIACTGHLIEGRPDMLRCWIFKRFQTTHSATLGHDLSADEALMASCNIFFYTLGRRLGADGIRAAYERFGVGRAYRLGVGPSAAGVADPHGVQDAILMGIGQGPVTWTPLHAADALATIARGGVRLEPRLIEGEEGSESERVPESLGYDPRAVEAVIRGLDGSVHNETHGTGNHLTFTVDAGGHVTDGAATREIREDIFNVPGVRLVGKTGTATSAREVVVLGRDGRPLLDESGEEETAVPDHSWFVVLAGPEGGPEGGRLKYAIAVMMENAGSGGKVSGPICNQIVWALVREGYLPRSAGAAGLDAGADVRVGVGAGGGP